MKKIITITIVGLIIIPLLANNLMDKPLGKITFFMGGIKVQNQGNSKWNNATFNSGVQANDKIRTDKQSRCEVTFSNKKVMRIGEKSIVEVTKDKAGIEEATVKKGSFWLSLFLPRGTSSFKLKSPSSVCSIRGTVYRMDCDENQSTYRCYKGEIAVTPYKEDGKTLADSTFKISAGEELILVMDFEEYKKQQEKAIEDFKTKEMEDFENFKKQDQQQFQEMLKKDEEDFKKVNDINYKKSTFDKEEDSKSDWVQWNSERDKLLQD
ncbi:MAG: FecR domain-containing protein [Calditrichaceae bacterium]